MKTTLLPSVVILLACLTVQPRLGHAQVREAWVARFSMGPDIVDTATSMASDAAGNVYVTGTTENTNTPNRFNEYLTVKFGPDGRLRWSARYRGASVGFNHARILRLDAAGNCYVTGYSQSEYPNGRLRVATVKYDSNGRELWAARYGEKSRSEPYDLKLDAVGNVYIAGSAQDFDGKTYLTIKIGPSGQVQWAREYTGERRDAEAFGVAADADGNVFVTGRAPGTNWINDIGTLKYTYDGTLEWSRVYDTPGKPLWSELGRALAMDGAGNLYLAGGGNAGFITLKYNTTGTQLWEAVVPSQFSEWESHYLAFDNAGNVIIGGWAPVPGEAMDWGVAKYTPLGTLLWSRLGHVMTNREDLLQGMVVGPDGAIYITAAGVTNSGRSIIATAKYSSSGTELWRMLYYDPTMVSGSPCGVGLDAAGNLYVAASVSVPTETKSDYVVIKYEQAAAAAHLGFAGFDATGRARLNLFARSNLTYTLEASANLRRWTPLATFTNRTGLVEVTDAETEGFAQKFYRARQP